MSAIETTRGTAAASYQMTRKDALKNALIEARKPIYEKRLEACISAVSMANTTA
jgi:hypothetical protein